MLSLNSNIASLKTQRSLLSSSQALTRGFERLSSGLRIVRPSDDAAGAAIATGARVDSRVFSQGLRNINDAISFFSIAESAASELSNILIRIKELAEQSANGTIN